MAITFTNARRAVTADHPRRYSIERDMSNGLYDVWDAHLSNYVAIDVNRAAALRAANRARNQGVPHA